MFWTPVLQDAVAVKTFFIYRVWIRGFAFDAEPRSKSRYRYRTKYRYRTCMMIKLRTIHLKFYSVG
jgi:hypothetical protein